MKRIRLGLLFLIFLVPATCHSQNITRSITFNQTLNQTVNITLPENVTITSAVLELEGLKTGPHKQNSTLQFGDFSFGRSYNKPPECKQTYKNCRLGGCETICSYYEEEKIDSTNLILRGENRTECSCQLEYYLEHKCRAETVNGKLLSCSTSSSICLDDECVNNGVSCEHETEDVPDRFAENIHGNKTLNCSCQNHNLIRKIRVYQDSYDWNTGSAGSKFKNSTLKFNYTYYTYPESLEISLGEIPVKTISYLNSTRKVNLTHYLTSGENLLKLRTHHPGGEALINISIHYNIKPQKPVHNLSFETGNETLTFRIPYHSSVRSAILEINNTKTGPHYHHYHKEFHNFLDAPECAQKYFSEGEELCSYYEDIRENTQIIQSVGENQTNCSCLIEQKTTKECASKILYYDNGDGKIEYKLEADANTQTCLNDACINHTITCHDYADHCDGPCEYGEKIHEEASLNLQPECNCSQTLTFRDELHVFQDSVSHTRAKSVIPEHRTTLNISYSYYTYPQNLTVQINNHTILTQEYANQTYSLNLMNKLLKGKNKLEISAAKLGGMSGLKLRINGNLTQLIKYYPTIKNNKTHENVTKEKTETETPQKEPVKEKKRKKSEKEDSIKTYRSISVNPTPEVIGSKKDNKKESVHPNKEDEGKNEDLEPAKIGVKSEEDGSKSEIAVNETHYYSEKINHEVKETEIIIQEDPSVGLFGENLKTSLKIVIDCVGDVKGCLTETSSLISKKAKSKAVEIAYSTYAERRAKEEELSMSDSLCNFLVRRFKGNSDANHYPCKEPQDDIQKKRDELVNSRLGYIADIIIPSVKTDLKKTYNHKNPVIETPEEFTKPPSAGKQYSEKGDSRIIGEPVGRLPVDEDNFGEWVSYGTVMVSSAAGTLTNSMVGVAKMAENTINDWFKQKREMEHKGEEINDLENYYEACEKVAAGVATTKEYNICSNPDKHAGNLIN